MTPCRSPLISARELAGAMAGDVADRPVLLDTSFDLSDLSAGEREYLAAHVPGALYLHLERDLSGAKQSTDGRFRGRHPLPDIDDFAALMGRSGIGIDSRVVVYDRQGGMMAARAWWLLRWLGHADVAVLDGAMPAWLAAGGTVESGPNPHLSRFDGQAPYPHHGPALPTVDADELQSKLQQMPLIDARAPERYRGEVEPLDAAAGHIPGASNRFFKDNLQADGRFKSAGQLAADFKPLIGERPVQDVIHQCGSGVTACHNMLAMEIAGLPGSRLYPGSWSEWSSNPERPIARG